MPPDDGRSTPDGEAEQAGLLNGGDSPPARRRADGSTPPAKEPDPMGGRAAPIFGVILFGSLLIAVGTGTWVRAIHVHHQRSHTKSRPPLSQRRSAPPPPPPPPPLPMRRPQPAGAVHSAARLPTRRAAPPPPPQAPYPPMPPYPLRPPTVLAAEPSILSSCGHLAQSVDSRSAGEEYPGGRNGGWRYFAEWSGLDDGQDDKAEPSEEESYDDGGHGPHYYSYDVAYHAYDSDTARLPPPPASPLAPRGGQRGGPPSDPAAARRVRLTPAPFLLNSDFSVARGAWRALFCPRHSAR